MGIFILVEAIEGSSRVCEWGSICATAQTCSSERLVSKITQSLKSGHSSLKNMFVFPVEIMFYKILFFKKLIIFHIFKLFWYGSIKNKF
jgi:hypothetical protein